MNNAVSLWWHYILNEPLEYGVKAIETEQGTIYHYDLIERDSKVASSITFDAMLDYEPKDDDQLYIDALRVAVASLTGLYPIRQRVNITQHIKHRMLSITVFEGRVPQCWIDGGQSLVRRGMFHAMTHKGETFKYDGLEVDFNWRIVPEETHVGTITFKNKAERLKACTKWDGCTHLWFEEEGEEACYHHICDLDIFTDVLKAQRERARTWFGGEFCLSTIDESELQGKIAEVQQQEQQHLIPFFAPVEGE